VWVYYPSNGTYDTLQCFCQSFHHASSHDLCLYPQFLLNAVKCTTKKMPQCFRETPKCSFVGPYSYTITSPQSMWFGRHLLVSSSPSMLLGTVTSIGRYRYHPFSAAAAALVRASSSELPAPSPNLSLPVYTPTTKTGCLLNRPVSDIRRATGGSKFSRAQSFDRSRVGVRKSKRVLTSRCLLRKWSRKKRLTIGAPRWACNAPMSALTKDCAASSIGTRVFCSACGLGGALSLPNSSVRVILCVVVTFQLQGTCLLNASGKLSPLCIRLNCNKPGSTSPPGSAAASMPHSLATVASAFGPMYASTAAKTTGIGRRGYVQRRYSEV